MPYKDLIQKYNLQITIYGQLCMFIFLLVSVQPITNWHINLSQISPAPE